MQCYSATDSYKTGVDDYSEQLSLFDPVQDSVSSTERVRSPGRQAQIMDLIAAGLSDKEIARELGISHRTVRTHLEKFYKKHGQRRRSAAVAFWVVQRSGAPAIRN